MKRIIFLLLIIVSSCGCKKDNSFNNSSDLIGSWSWLSTCAGSYTDCFTPATTHRLNRIVFTTDSIYNFYQNDTLKSTTKFHTYTSISDDGKYTTHFIKYDSASMERYSITHDTLSLIDDDPNNLLSNSSLYKRIN